MIKQELHTGGEQHPPEHVRVLFHEPRNAAIGCEETQNTAPGGRKPGKVSDQAEPDGCKKGGQLSGKQDGKQEEDEQQIDAETEEKKPGEMPGEGKEADR